MKLSLFLVMTAASQAWAHYRFASLIANGATQPQFKYIRQWTPIYSNSPVTSVNSVDIRCNVAPTTSNGGQTDVIEIQAGSQVGFQSDQTVTHPGPFAAYLGKAPGDVKAWDGSGANWFKIWEKGPTSISASGVTWDTTSTRWTFNIPQNTPPGQYLLRIEHVGLHSASSPGGAQFYISCAQVNIVGGGSGSPPKVSFPGAYSQNDPGLVINIYYPIPTRYTVPGPRPWTG